MIVFLMYNVMINDVGCEEGVAFVLLDLVSSNNGCCWVLFTRT